ncbi:PrsW family glutamic-type intramembrane protease [Microbacterium testaceum]|uniref:PrsW family intramembrane metalloprotease n=1 Tax=Microbacterium testaceum TaxID=2033 RepID=UPI00342893B0
MSTAEKHITRTHRHAPRRREHRHTHTVWFFVGGVFVWLYLGIVVLHLLRNSAVAPTWIFVGAALVPATIFWIMVHRLRTTDSISAVNLVVAAVIGGTLALTLAGTLDTLTGLIPQPNVAGEPVLMLALAGFVEEFCKGLLMVLVGWKLVKTPRNGLFVGGAVGLGFAVLETMAYIGAKFTGADPILSAAGEAAERGLLAPFGHVLWSALFGAALFSAAAKKGRFRLSWLVIGTYVAVAILHGAWDGSGVLVVALTGNQIVGMAVQILGWALSIIGGALIWRHIARKEPAPPIVDEGSPAAVGPAAEARVVEPPAAPLPA